MDQVGSVKDDVRQLGEDVVNTLVVSASDGIVPDADEGD